MKNIRMKLRKAEGTVLGKLLLVLEYAVASILLSLVYYTVFALIVNTDIEKRLRKENRMYEKIYPEMQEKAKLISDVIDGLQAKDGKVYQDVFYSKAPVLDPVNTTSLIAITDTFPARNLIKYTRRKADALLAAADSVEADFARVIEAYSAPEPSLPPLCLPLKNITYVQVGASVGVKMNPFYKIEAMHGGLDMIASQGDPVYSAAPGRVSAVARSHKGEGNVVEITHAGGYVTRYCHLGDIFVSQGQQVDVGRRIAEVGLSGNSFVTHLHYEVLKDGDRVDPVHYFFASVTPYNYTNMLYMSVSTGQSMD